MAHEARLIVEAGPCKGREYVVPENGSARAGRSSQNDIALTDPSVSRFHCRIFWKPGSGLWLADLSSANRTLVNGRPVQEIRIEPQDRIQIGDSILKVISDGSDAAAAPEPAAASPPAARPASPGGEVDLGLAATETRRRSAGPNARLLLLLIALMAMSVLVVWIFFFRKSQPVKPVVTSSGSELEVFELRYEKVNAGVSNIFQCVLTIRGTQAGIEYHDVADKKHFRKPMIDVDRHEVAELLAAIEQTGVLSLPRTEYVETSQNTYNLLDLNVLLGTNAYRVKVLNAAEPLELANAVKILDTFGENQFNIRSWTYSREDLIRLADEKRELGLKLYEGKNRSSENLYNARRNLSEAIIFLETVDPKPDFYRELVAMHEKCDTELKTLLKELRLQADLAMKVDDWHEAAAILRRLCDTVPERSDEVYRTAEQDLTKVERKMKK